MPALSLSSQKILLDLARTSIQIFIKTKKYAEFKPQTLDISMASACFITLKKNGQLRGCIGTFSASKPLYQNIIHMAVSAALEDPRFPAVSLNELEQVKIEISVLSDFRPMLSPEDLEIGKHGIVVRCGAKSGTYLPDVAIEQKWSKQEFIYRCAAEKAGLSPDEIVEAQMFIYEVQKFSE